MKLATLNNNDHNLDFKLFSLEPVQCFYQLIYDERNI